MHHRISPGTTPTAGTGMLTIKINDGKMRANVSVHVILFILIIFVDQPTSQQQFACKRKLSRHMNMRLLILVLFAIFFLASFSL